MKIDYDKEFKKLKKWEYGSVFAGGIVLGLLTTIHKYIGAKENGLRTAQRIDDIMENLENQKKE